MLGLFHTLEPIARPVVAIFLNGIWQGALIAFAVWLILRTFPRVNASTRYAAWTAALAATIALPIITSLPRVSVPISHVAPTNAARVPALSEQREPRFTKVAAAPAVPRQTSVEPARLPQPPQVSLPNASAAALFAVWGVIALAILVRIVLSLVQLERLKRDALPLRLEHRDTMERWNAAAKGSREVRICVSDQIEVPVAVGLFDAMILLPKSLLERLDGKEIDQISLHELAHLRRADDWTNGLQRLAQALLFFNPAVLFISRQMDLEREVACDDWVLGLTGDVRPYAFCLTKMAEVTSWPHSPLAAPGVFASRRHISIRIERLLAARRAIGSTLAPGASMAVAGGLAALAVVLLAVTPSIAYTGVTSGEASSGVVAIKGHHVSGTSTAHPVVKPAAHREHAVKPTERPPAVVPGGPKTVAYTIMKSRQLENAAPTRALAPAPAPHAPSLPRTAAVANLHSHTAAVAETLGVAAGVSAAAGAAAAARAEGVAAAARSLYALNPSHALARAGLTCTGCDYSGANLAGHDFSGQSMVGSDFSGANLRGANFRNAHLSGSDFSKADLRNASFAGANLEGCDMQGADLAGVDFTGAKLNGCDIDVAALSPSQAALILRACSGCDFSNADLRGRDLRGVTITGADLSGADFRGADLSNASFSGVDLSKAKFEGAKLYNTRFSGCDFAGTDLRNVDFSHAIVSGSSLGDAIMR